MEQNTDNNNNKKFIQDLDKLYKNLTYFDIYSGSLVLFVLLSILLFVCHMYFITMSNANEIKQDWNANRCKPQNILFAGFINKPYDKTIFEYTSENFNYCTQNILKSVSSYAFQPLYYLYDSIESIYNQINNDIQAIREIISNIRTDIQNIVQQIMGKLLNIMVPIQVMISTLSDIFGKVQGVLTASLMTALGSYFALQSLMGSIIQFIIIILIGLAIVILALWLGFFTWPVAVIMTVMFAAISIPLTIIVVFMTQMLHIHTASVPSVPHGSKPKCFDENTKFILKNGSIKKIKDLEIYDVLINNSKITSIIKLNSLNETMYKINDIIVSGSHPVLYERRWILVKDHPFSSIIEDYNKPYLYCINTDKKIIQINNIIFSDWDELYNSLDLNSIFLRKLNKNNILKFEYIHVYLDKGFERYENIELYDNTFKNIIDVNIGDKLVNGELVYGIVKLRNNKSSLKNEKDTNNFYMYNLLTDKGTFKIKNTIINDYNSCINYLNK